MRLYRRESRVSRAIVQIITIEPWPPVLGRKRIMVDRVQWGTIFMESHGPRGNHYWFSQQGTGGAILDRDRERRPGDRRTVKVESYDLAGRPGTRERDKELSDRLHAMAGSLIERGLLVHPDVIVGQKADRERALAEREAAERAERRKSDFKKAFSTIRAHTVPDSVDSSQRAVILDCDKLAYAIADLIENARSRAI